MGILDKYGMNWRVEKYPAYMKVGDRFVRVPKRMFTARVDDEQAVNSGEADPIPFEACGSDYEIIQNEQGMEFLASLVADGELIMDQALETKRGEVIAINTRKPNNVVIAGSEVAQFLTFTNVHSAKGSAQVLTHNMNLFCANQLAALTMAAAFKHTIRHTRNARARLEDARIALTKSDEHTQELKKLLEKWATQKISKAYYNRFLKVLVGLTEIDPNKNPKKHARAIGLRYAIHEIMKNAEYMNDYRGTKLMLYQGVTDWTSNVQKVRGDANTRFLRMASGHPLTSKAYEMLEAGGL